MLRNPEVCRVDLTEMNLIPSLYERFEQVENEPTSSGGEEPFHVLKNERAGTVPGDEIRVDPHERVPFVVGLTSSGGREPLTGWPSCNHVGIREVGGIVDGLGGDVIAQVRPVGINRRSPAIDSVDGLKSRLAQAKRKPSRAAEQVGNGQPPCVHGGSVWDRCLGGLSTLRPLRGGT